MFATPHVIETQIFARVPEELRHHGGASTVSRILGHEVDCFLEGPSFDRQGYLYCVDVPYGRIFRIDPQGQFEVFVEYDGQPNGLKIHADGRLFIADRRHGIVVIDPKDRQVQYVTSGVDLERFIGPNDLVFSPGGDLYFTDQGMSDYVNRTGRVYRLRAGGALELLLDGLVSPNGIALDLSGRFLYVALTRENCILKALLLPDGRVSRVQKFIQLSGGGGPDGLAIDAEGAVVVAHPQMGSVWRFDAKGEPTLRVKLCEGLLGTNLAFGGSDGRRLYITESQTGTIQMAELPTPGVPMFSHIRM